MPSIIAFAGDCRLAAGDPIDVALEVKRRLDDGEDRPVLAFDRTTSRIVELDLRGDESEIRARMTPKDCDAQPAASRGRPKLGVIAREVTLLPQQWEWLAMQRVGASAALRRLVNDAQRKGAGTEARQQAQEALHRFITVMAGDAVGYEEAVRALFAGDEESFRRRIAAWSGDVQAHTLDLASHAFEAGGSSSARPISTGR